MPENKALFAFTNACDRTGGAGILNLTFSILVEGDSARPIYRALNEHVMGLLIDVPYAGDKNGCVSLSFLGKQARFPLGPAKLAKRSQSFTLNHCKKVSGTGF
jgi:lauroyl/myristoyl acyltransferase